MPALDDGFRVRYLGCTSFQNGKKQVGISVLQRPLLELYSAARKRGEEQRSAHPLALTQRLDVSDYGLVVADSEVDRDTGDTVPVITKVITPLPNIVLWVASRFNSRIVKRKVFGAAFVPIACSEAVVDPKSYVQLGSKQRFLVSLTHPSIFACLLRSVASPKFLECHAFVCATAEDAITLCSHLGTIKEQGASQVPIPIPQTPIRTSRSEGSCVPWTESESPSDITVPSELAPPVPNNDGRNFLALPSYHYGRSVNKTSKNRENTDKNERRNITEKPHHVERELSVYRKPSKSKHELRRPTPPIIDNRSKGYKTMNERFSRKEMHPLPKPNSTSRNIITLNVNSPNYNNESKRPTDFTAESEGGSSLARIDERWEPYWNPYRNDYRAGNFSQNPSTSGGSALSKHKTKPRRMRDMATMTDDYLWTTDASSWLPSDEPDSWMSSPTTSDSAVAKSPLLTRRKYEDMVLTETMDFGSESGEESSFGEPWHKIDWQKKQSANSCTKVTYFGYECFRPSAGTESDAISSDAISHRKSNERYRSRNSRAVQSIPITSHNQTTYVKDNRITIDVPYTNQRMSTPDSSIYLVPNPRTTCHVPQGIRSYQKNGQVRNWSNLSQISDSSCKRSATLPAPPKPPRLSATKAIRWSSDEQIAKKHNFLATIKRISTSSFRKAKKKTGKMFSSFRNKLHDKKKTKNTTEYSEDSAYDTSEVCLSPHGKQQFNPKMKKRRLSWSFHDLRLALPAVKQNDEKNLHRPSSPVGSALGGSTARQLVMKKKRRKRRKKTGPSRGHSSSDSGVEEYYSDYSGNVNNIYRRPESEVEQFANQVTRVKVKHGMSKEGFHRWSHTDLHNELGYIP